MKYLLPIILFALSFAASADFIYPGQTRLVTLHAINGGSQSVTGSNTYLNIATDGDYSVKATGFKYTYPGYRPPRYYDLDVLSVDVIDGAGTVVAHSESHNPLIDAPAAQGHLLPGLYQIQVHTWLTGYNGAWGWYGKYIIRASEVFP